MVKALYKKSIKTLMLSGVIVAMALPGVSKAAPAESLLTDKNLQLAMLDMVKSPLSLQQFSQNQAIKGTDQVFSSNCMQWSARQINQKAQPYAKIINKYAKKHRIDSNLIKSVITAESCFKRKAVSTAGASGLMQLIPDTASRFGVSKIFNPAQNIRGGVTYLRFLLDRYKNDLKKTIAAYNAGEGRVDHYKGIPPFKETKQYVKNVLKVYDLLSPNRKNRVTAVYYPPSLGNKPGRHGWQYNRQLAPHLYKQTK